MANILGLKGYTKNTGEKILIAAYGNDLVNVSSGAGYGLAMNPDLRVEFDVFLDCLFFQNYYNTPLSFNGSAWSRKHVGKVPLAKIIRTWKDRLYFGYVKIGSTEYGSRVWRSDLPKNDTLVWGYASGSDLVTCAGSAVVNSVTGGFSEYGIEEGDPFFITSGSDAGEYIVSSVDWDQQITLTESLTATGSGISYWAGNNFYDVSRDDGDYLVQLIGNNDQLLNYKRDSLWRYDLTTLRQIPGAIGTTSARSVKNLHDWTISFYSGIDRQTGFYACDGTSQIKISSSIEKHILAMDKSVDPVAWLEGELYRAYIGDLNDLANNIFVNKAVATFDYETKKWSVDPIADVIRCAADFRQASQKDSFLGTNSDKILRTPSGYDFDGEPIMWSFETKSYYPVGTHEINTFLRTEIISKDGEGIKVLYKRLLKPYDSDEQWLPLGEIQHEKQVFEIPEPDNLSSGIKLKFIRTDTQKPTSIIKKISFIYRTEKMRI